MNEEKSRRYHRLKRRTAVLSVTVTASLLVVLLATGASAAIRNAAAITADGGSGRVAAYVCLLLVLQEVIGFPLALYSGFILERRYGLSSQPLTRWMLDRAKGSVIGAALTLGGAEVVYAALRWSPRWWWAVAALVFAAVTILIAQVAPIILLPIFYRFKPIAAEPLYARLSELSARAGAPVLGVYEWSLGEKTRRANAALVGVGATRRILLSDTLLAEYSEEEIEVILAHELGHHVHRDILKALAFEAGVLLAGFAAAAAVLSTCWRPLSLASPTDVAGLPLLLLVGGTVSICATPIWNMLSRRSERHADRYALDLTHRPTAFISAMRRLAAQNLAEEHPSPMTVWLFHSHPPVEQRIDAAREFQNGCGLRIAGCGMHDANAECGSEP